MRARDALLPLALCLFALPAAAHRLAPALLELRERPQAGGTPVVDVRLRLPRLAPAGADREPDLPPHCRTVGAGTAREDARALTLRWSVDCGEDGLVGARLGVSGLTRAGTDVLLRVELADGRLSERLLTGSSPEWRVPAQPSRADVLRDCIALGTRHIASGPDHLLFVLGLVLLITDRRRLLLTVTAFTLGHSVTLASAALGWVHVPTALVEIAIAGTLFVLAVELAREEGAAAGILRRHPEAMAAGFGLLHGLGFAGALAEVGLPAAAIPLALLGFNLGIELGQIGFVVGVLALRWLARAAALPPAWLVQAPAYAIGSLAVYWCLERFGAALR